MFSPNAVNDVALRLAVAIVENEKDNDNHSYLQPEPCAAGCGRAGRLHGYAIASLIPEKSNGALGIEDGALYQGLHRMEERGWVESEWGHTQIGKRARFYRLTEEGKNRLQVETGSWVRYVEAVFRVLEMA